MVIKFMKIDEKIIVRNLTDEEIDQLSSEEQFEIMIQYMEEIPYENTVQGLLEENDISTDGLSEFVLGMDVGRCNTAIRTDNRIYINRPNSKWKDNIVINLKDDSEVPPIIVQIGDEEFMHEEAYDFDGFEIYRT